ncbi:hypothetical protein H4582DRAFT_2066326 [Lactarius indigo]|nr:hypothetical protein H4582DRAFT_2066326 [Lactarius indigo]
MVGRTCTTKRHVLGSLDVADAVLDAPSRNRRAIGPRPSTFPLLLSWGCRARTLSLNPQISPADIPLLGGPLLLSAPSASIGVSMSSPQARNTVAPVHSDLLTIPCKVALSKRAPSKQTRSERPLSKRPRYLHGIENDRQHNNQGVHDHLGDIQNEQSPITFTKRRFHKFYHPLLSDSKIAPLEEAILYRRVNLVVHLIIPPDHVGHPQEL